MLLLELWKSLSHLCTFLTSFNFSSAFDLTALSLWRINSIPKTCIDDQCWAAKIRLFKKQGETSFFQFFRKLHHQINFNIFTLTKIQIEILPYWKMFFEFCHMLIKAWLRIAWKYCLKWFIQAIDDWLNLIFVIFLVFFLQCR